MKIDQKELKERIKTEKSTLKSLKGEQREVSKSYGQLDRKVNAQEKLIARLETKKK